MNKKDERKNERKRKNRKRTEKEQKKEQKQFDICESGTKMQKKLGFSDPNIFYITVLENYKVSGSNNIGLDHIFQINVAPQLSG